MNAWESNQLKSAEVQEESENEYDYVFDSDQEVDFEQGSPQESGSDDEPESQELPVVQHKSEILNLIQKTQVIIVAGETGSGKTTQIPQFLHEAHYTKKGMVGCTQPRRLAAIAVAARVAQENGSPLGKTVGYSVRFEEKSCAATKIKYMTDGMLLREFLRDDSLSKYAAIMVDEAHERTLHTDILLSLLRDVARSRSELKIIISSATLNAQKFSTFFDNCEIYHVPGRRFPVDIFYTKQVESDYMQAALVTVFQIHTTQDIDGDILVFLPGQEEIEILEESLLQTQFASSNFIVCPLYANMPLEQQTRIYDDPPPGCRKIILATNIAETSLTIDGVKYVVDPGLVKQNVFDPKLSVESLKVVECSKASADQRAGRAGRTGPGQCFRLYTRKAFEEDHPQDTLPEVLRASLAGVVLLLMVLGVKNVVKFQFMDPPEVIGIVKALELLYSLGAVNKNCELTTMGRKMAEFPTEPLMSRTLLAGLEFECAEDLCTIMSLLGQLGSVFYRPKNRKEEANRIHKSFYSTKGDYHSLLKLYSRWSESGCSSQWCRDHFVQYKTLLRARKVRDQLVRLCRKVPANVNRAVNDGNDIERAFISGYFVQLATSIPSAKGDTFRTFRNKLIVFLHPSSFMYGEDQPKMVLYHELVETSREYMRGVLAVDPILVRELVPHVYKEVERHSARLVR